MSLLQFKALQHLTEQPLALIDLGSSVTRCLLVPSQASPTLRESANSESHRSKKGGVRILGYASCKTEGFHNGSVTNFEALEQSLRLCLAQAEAHSRSQAHRAILSFSGSNLHADFCHISKPPGQSTITQQDLEELRQQAKNSFYSASKNTETSHCPQLLQTLLHYYLVDGKQTQNPQHYYADKLEAQMSLLSMPRKSYQNVRQVFERAHLSVEAITSSSYAGALAVIPKQELIFGSLVLDIGHDQTTALILKDGALRYLQSFPFGGNILTQDLAQVLGVTLEDAEKIKTLHASLLSSEFLQDKVIKFTGNSPSAPKTISFTLGELSRILLPRVEEMVEVLYHALELPLKELPKTSHLFLLGGGSHLNGLQDYLQQRFARRCQLGHYTKKAIPQDLRYPQMIQALGLLEPQVVETRLDEQSPTALNSDYLLEEGLSYRIKHWIKESLR